MEPKENFKLSVNWEKDIWLFDKKPYVIGTNFGPYRTNAFFSEYLKLFKKAKLLHFRDKYSVNLFKNHICCLYSPDLVFSLIWKENFNPVETEVFISVINMATVCSDTAIVKRYERFIIELINWFGSHNKKVVLAGFCERLGDKTAIDNITSFIIRQDLCREICYPENSEDEIIEALINSNRVIATRHHAMVLALKYGKPLFTIVYNPKMEYMLDDLCLPKSSYAKIDELQGLTIDDVVNSMYIAEEESRTEWRVATNGIFKLVEEKLKQ